MQINSEIFKSYDIRGTVGPDLNPDVARAVGRAYADFLTTEGPVAVGHDMRADSRELADALIEGLRMQGRDVWDIGQIASDMVYFAAGKYELAGGAVVTASHNPGKDNGIKLVREEAQPIGMGIGLDEIRDAAIAGDFKESEHEGELTHKDVTEDWIAHVLSFVGDIELKPYHIAVDAGNGMAGAIFPHLEKHVPFTVEQMYFELDGTFPNHEANPLKFETLADLIAKIKDMKLDFGVAFDGDGDRAFLVDDMGEVITGGVMSAMLAEHFLEMNPGANIVYDVRNSRSVPEVVKENGGTPVIEVVGHSHIKAKMRAVDAPFGGEASGHYYFKDLWYADSGLVAAVVAIAVLSKTGKKLSEVREQFTRYEAMPEANFTVEDKQAAIDAVAAAFPDEEHNRMDGLTIEFDNDSWFNVRPSNTEPLLRLNAEAKTQEDLDALVDKVKQAGGLTS